MSTDSLLIIGVHDQKLLAFLKKFGYQVSTHELGSKVHELPPGKVFDLVLLRGDVSASAQHLFDFFRSQPATKDAAYLVVVADEAEAAEIVSDEKTQVLTELPGVGSMAGKIATLLRLRKFAGEDSFAATLAEANAALRELNQRFQKDLEEARTIQENLLPKKLPTDPRFQLAVVYDPLEQVGGDWYYVKTEEDGWLSVLIADVTGHGLSAAFIGSMTKLAMLASEEAQPDARLTRMNELMAQSLPSGTFVTMFDYSYDPESGCLKFARAGHPPGLLMRRSAGTVEQLLGEGFAIGFFEDSSYTAMEANLEIGDVLVVFTDAIPESQNLSGTQYDYDRVSKVLLDADPGASSEEILKSILKDFTAFREGRLLKDDVTVIVLKRIE